ncbi:MAG: protein kinase [Lysobacterales bacterium]
MGARRLLEPGVLWSGALAREWARAEAIELATGTRLGPFCIEAEIGRGGMGVVYRAERADGEFAQTVAIKCVSDRGGEQGAEQFRRERQILAGLKHPHIARLIDGGRSADGWLWFAMELVNGERIDRHCHQRRLGVDERLRLFLQVVDAVQFAHARLLIHRDIKPGNVLVDADGCARLLDFGIANVVGSADGLRAYTPGYASPEQRLGADVGTASDQYQLGRLLISLLTAEPDPAPAITAAPGQSPKPRAGWLPMPRYRQRELRDVLARACAEAPEARYGSVAEFGRDIQRLLAHQPVDARQAGPAYRLGCAIRRQPGAALGSLLAGLAFLALVILFNLRVSEERDVARAEAERAQRAEARALAEARRVGAISQFVNEDLLGAASPVRRAIGAPPMTVDTALELAAQAVERRYANDPDLAVAVWTTLAQVQNEFGHYPEAVALTDRALALASEAKLPAPATYRALGERGFALLPLQRYPEAIAALEPLVADPNASALFPKEEVLWWAFHLIDAQSRQGALPERLADYQSLADRARGELGPINGVTGMALLRIARQARAQGLPGSRPEPALEALKILQQVEGVDSHQALLAQVEYGLSRCNAGMAAECLALVNEALRLQIQRFGEQDLDAMNFQSDLGYAYGRLGRWTEAAQAYTRALDLRVAALGPQSPQVMTVAANLALAQLRAGQTAAALASSAQALAIVDAQPTLAASLQVAVLRVRAEALLQDGQLDAAAAVLDRGEGLGETLPELDVRRLTLAAARARWYALSGDPDEARRRLDPAIAGLQQQWPADHPQLAPLLALQTALRD